MGWKKLYLEYSIEIGGKSLLTFIFGMLLGGCIVALVHFLRNGNQVAATILAGLIAFAGAMITVTAQSRLTIYRSQLDQRRDGTNKMAPYYEGVIKLLKDPDSYSSKEISNFINEFDNKLEIYGSETVSDDKALKITGYHWPCFAEAMYLALQRGGWVMQN